MNMEARRLQLLRAMDIDVWQRRVLPEAPAPQLVPQPVSAPASESVSVAVPPHVATTVVESSDSLDTVGWEELRRRVSQCTLCGLQDTRTQTVFGVGDTQAEWMIIGEAPGADEDRQGEPFVGRAGQLLNSMLKAMGFPRPQVFIANVLKCRPPNNRDPKPEEVACCLPYLARQIELVNPRVILCVGRIAAQNLLNSTLPIGKLRGSVHRLGAAQRPVVVTYHPAYLLRSPGEKRRAWDDLQLALKVFAETKRSEAMPGGTA